MKEEDEEIEIGKKTAQMGGIVPEDSGDPYHVHGRTAEGGCHHSILQEAGKAKVGCRGGKNTKGQSTVLEVIKQFTSLPILRRMSFG